MGTEEQKQAAAEYAAALVKDGMFVGLGSGSTSEVAVHTLGRRVQAGLQFTAIPTSKKTEQIARSYGIPLKRLDERTQLDLYLDGADEVDPRLNLVKGRGGALLREKLVTQASSRFVVMVDRTKRVPRLGARMPIPVEIVPFGWPTTRHRLERLGFVCRRRGDDHPYMTLNHNYILDCHADPTVDLADPDIAAEIKRQTGVVEHGLFLGMVAVVVSGNDDGTVEVLEA